MDFGSAALLVAMVFLVVELAARLFPTLDARAKVVIAIVAGQAVAFLTANSDWGPKQVVDSIPLDKMNGGSLILVGLALGGIATVGKQIINAVPNIGENQPSNDG